jgi:hypothetical protein
MFKNFIQRPGQLVLVVYVKEIDQESLQVNFDVKALRLKFRTRYGKSKLQLGYLWLKQFRA